MTTLHDDPVIEELRKHRERRTEEFHHDLRAIFEDLKRLESALEPRLVHLRRPSDRRK